MPNDYAPKLFLRQADNALLKDYFSSRGELQDIDWDKLRETTVESIYARWHELPEASIEQVERDFREIFELGSEDGVRTLIDESRFHTPDLDLAAELEGCDGYVNKALWVFLNQRTLFELAAILDRADHLNGRYWRKRKGLPQKAPDFSGPALQELGAAYRTIFAIYSQDALQFPTPADASWKDVRLARHATGGIRIAVSTTEKFAVSGYDEDQDGGAAYHQWQSAQRAGTVERIYDLRTLGLADDQGRPKRPGEALLAVLAGKGAVQRRADDRGMLELGGILSKLMGIANAPFRFAQSNEQWSACFTVES